ncbi:MAG: NAD-dependent epimerase/dehydratase family protein [Melioribacteraceae bacterium]|nr:NAD-dependent epimerase/dehydratase family protein [Melioribacteraceae bacterium]
MLKIVIAGGAGFIGSNLAGYFLDKGEEVLVIDNLRTGKEENLNNFNNINFVRGSITDKKLVEENLSGADVVFNMAALVSVPESVDKPLETVEINTKGVINLLEASLKHNVKKVVLSSSAAIYGNNPQLPKKTNMFPEPVSPYAITKLSGEYFLNLYTKEHDLKTVSLRYFNVYGPKQDPKSQYAAAIPIFIERSLKNEKIIIYGDGQQTRDFIYIDDVVKANVSAFEKQDVTGVYNVANGESITILELAQKIIEATNSKSAIKFAGERKGDVKHSLASIESTREKLGFKPSVKLEDGLMKTIQYFERKLR